MVSFEAQNRDPHNRIRTFWKTGQSFHLNRMTISRLLLDFSSPAKTLPSTIRPNWGPMDYEIK